MTYNPDDFEGGEDRHLEAAYEDRFAMEDDGPYADDLEADGFGPEYDDDEDAWALNMEHSMLGGPFDDN